jgi:hypothetical protein
MRRLLIGSMKILFLKLAPLLVVTTLLVMGSIAIGWGHWFRVAEVPGRTCYQLTQPLLAIPALMHPEVEWALLSPFHTHVLKNPFT